jgi:crotonobetainyl-CoA:carnitine CoA-transferase CaiB-like acyl-CoA transferase
LSSLEKFWQGLTSAVDSARLTEDERFRTRHGRIAHYEELGAELDALFLQRPTQYWVERLGQHDVPFAPIHRVDEVVNDPQVKHLGLIVPVESANGGKQAVRPAVQFDGERSTSVRSAPLLDEHGAAIRQALTEGDGWRRAQDAARTAEYD